MKFCGFCHQTKRAVVQLKPRVLMLAWEYPPEHVGGLGRHVCHLGRALVRLGTQVTVLTRGAGKTWSDEGVRVVPALPYCLNPPEFLTWAAQFNVSLMECAVKEFAPDEFDLIHGHDWLVAYACRALKHSWDLPLVATIHATEHGRQKGLHNPGQGHISETEWFLCYEAWRVITCSQYMRSEVCNLFGLPGDKVRVIPNGISPTWFFVKRKPDPDPLVVFVGRLVPEKGPHVLVEAMPFILREFPKANLVLAGKGPMEGDIRRRMYELGLNSVVHLPGHLDDRGLKDLYSRAHVACFPSSYEPFGIVALEAMATGAPCVVGNAGGLAEIIEGGRTGLKVRPNDPPGLGEAIRGLLRDEDLRDDLSRSAREVAYTDYSWDDIARSTLEVYGEVLGKRFLPSTTGKRAVGTPVAASTGDGGAELELPGERNGGTEREGPGETR